jgi:hypothetical protein
VYISVDHFPEASKTLVHNLPATKSQAYPSPAAGRYLRGLSTLLICFPLCATVQAQAAPDWTAGHVIVNPAKHFDQSQPLTAMAGMWKPPAPSNRVRHVTEGGPHQEDTAGPLMPKIPEAAAAIEQTAQGAEAAPQLLASFDGLGAGFTGPQGPAAGRNPSDNSLAVGPDEIVQIVNSHLAVYGKQGKTYPTTGKVLFGAVITNTLFAGFGGPCEQQVSGDAVVRYDQLANRWLFVVPIFRKPAPDAPYAMCYAVSTGPSPLGSYYRYEFTRPLFPDYPRPAIWPNGYYVPTSTGDTVIQKHICAANREAMLHGKAASEQCFIIDGVNFLNAADVDGKRLPPKGMPEVVLAAGGTQLHQQFEDDALFAWRDFIDWKHPEHSHLDGPEKIAVAPYHYLCDGQLSKCVPQPGTQTRLDAQGDKLMQRLVYRNLGSKQFIVAAHSVDTSASGGGVRWYQFAVDDQGSVKLAQQGTYAPDGGFRWMPSAGMDRKGDIAVGYSFGDSSTFTGQRFAARLASDKPGSMTLHESVLADGKAAQTNSLRWEDYTTLALDPSDDCTFWYVGDYLKAGDDSYSTRIGSWRLPGCGAKK